MGLVEEMIKVTIQEMVDFRSTGFSGCSLHHIKNSRCYCERCQENCYTMVCQQTKRSVSLAGRQRATNNKIKILLWKSAEN